MRLNVTVKDLKQVGTAASQNCTVGHEFVTTHLGNKEKEGSLNQDRGGNA